jgi:hypothetical protein
MYHFKNNQGAMKLDDGKNIMKMQKKLHAAMNKFGI